MICQVLAGPCGQLCFKFLYQIASFLKQEFTTCRGQMHSELLMTIPTLVQISHLSRARFKFPTPRVRTTVLCPGVARGSGRGRRGNVEIRINQCITEQLLLIKKRISYQLIRPAKCDIHSLTSLDYIILCYQVFQRQPAEGVAFRYFQK